MVATVKSLEGRPIEEYAYQLGRHWGIGEKSRNNGALLIVAPNEKKVRIEVGYGLEGTITDAYSSRVIRDHIAPAFQRQQYAQGLNAAADAASRAAIEVLETLPPSAELAMAYAAQAPVQLIRRDTPPAASSSAAANAQPTPAP